MKENQVNQNSCTVQECDTAFINQLGGAAMYTIYLLQGRGNVTVDLVEYIFEGKIVLFTTPYPV